MRFKSQRGLIVAHKICSPFLVTKFSAKQKDATIQVFRAAQLTNFVGGGSLGARAIEKPEGNVEKPILVLPKRYRKNLENDNESIERIMKSFQDFLKHSNVPKIEETAPNIVKKDDLKSAKSQKRTQTQQESIAVNYKAYINACVNSGMKNRGIFALRSLSMLKTQYHDISMYTILMHSFATQGNWKKVKEICDTLAQNEVAYTPQVYAAICECIGRSDDSKENRKLLTEYLSKAANQQITMNDILDKSKFVRDQREFAIAALRRIHRNFTPEYTPPQLLYSNPLVDSLNEGILPIEKKNQVIVSLFLSAGLRLKNHIYLHDFQPTIESMRHKISNAKQGFSPDELQTLAHEQMENEKEGVIMVKNVSVNASTITEESKWCRDKIDELFKEWRPVLLQAFERTVSIAQHKMNNKSPGRVNIYPYMKLMKPEHYVDIMLQELKNLGEGSDVFTPMTLILYKRLGMRVHARYRLEQRYETGIADKKLRLYNEYVTQLISGNSCDNPRQLWQRITHHERGNGPDIDVLEAYWPWNVLCDIGKFLLNVLLYEIKIDANIMKRQKGSNSPAMLVPVLYTTYRNRNLLLREELRPHPVYMQLFRTAQNDYLTFGTDLVPMVCPPVPWTSHKQGGYFNTQSYLLRLPHPSGLQYDRIEHKSGPSDLYPSLDSLNQLGCIPWRVNTRILDIVIDIFNRGGSEELNVPFVPFLTKTKTLATPDMVNDLGAMMAISLSGLEKDAMYSLRCDTLYKLSLANHFRDKTFWLPYNMDFRGRVYPIPPHLNHLSADLTRSMLLFHQKQPLGEDGLTWLKLHCINLTGLKKRESVQNRIAFAETVMHEIIDSADNPLEGRRWWATSDEPWQTLSCCMEIVNAIRSPDPAAYMSGYPIHQDGSCNGLQHYAALGRDKMGAISVNLSPCDKPQDVYSTVASLVEKARAKDASRGNALAQALDGEIKRKLIKQTVMTTVYGVTKYGARLQIEKQLKCSSQFPRSLVSAASQYLALKTFESLGGMFASATNIQDWFTDCAKFISKQHANVEWVTPLGLPVVQPYMTKAKSGLKVLNVSNLIQGRWGDHFAETNKMKQRNAFPPNFIHSLDSCHMMLTSLYCERAGITFVSVHDCFWTHANAVPIMNRICRDQFVSLHSKPILDDLAKFFRENYKE